VYVLWRDGHQCQHCKGKSGDKILNAHHLESRKTGGNAPNNLITLCETCHKAYHAGTITLKQKRGGVFKDAAFMGIMRWAFFEELKRRYANVRLTYGYITKHTRIAHGLEKAHRIDARCISGNPQAVSACEWFARKTVREHNRQIHKATIGKGGKRKLNQAPKYVRGFRLFDKVRLRGEECFVFGRRASGSFDVRKLDGTRISAGISCKKLTLLERGGTILTERRAG
jgi:N6-L-threonylcarbamoyladenine synthase